MSEPLAHYAFLPWMRQGIGNKIAEADLQGSTPGGGDADVRATLSVKLAIDATDIEDGAVDEVVVNKSLQIMGPPDVVAISKDAIVRVEPQPKVNSYEASGLPYIEFYEEDFLWRYTPAKAGSNGSAVGRLTPWLALICLKQEEFTLKNTSDGRSFITINEGAIGSVFHHPTQHWAWGHVHLNTELNADTLQGQINEVSSELDADPDSGVSRLLCPRKLQKETSYTAFLVPAFETGRLAGLSADYDAVKAQEMSWGQANYAAKTRGYDYPVYHMWSFATGRNGDFESLARLLEAVVVPPELGKRDMYVADPGYGLDEHDMDSPVLGLEGALKPTDFVSDDFADGAGDASYQNHLRKLLNLSIDHSQRQTDFEDLADDILNGHPFYSASLGDDPIVTPHIYGRWHGLVNRLGADHNVNWTSNNNNNLLNIHLQNNNNHPWVNDLNLDPRNRAAAGLGTVVVQKEQENYMRRAWEQVQEIKAANEKIRKAAVNKLVTGALYKKHIENAGADQSIRRTAPMHTFTKTGAKTAAFEMTKSLVPDAVRSAAFKKITRPNKKGMRKFNHTVLNANPNADLPFQKVVTNFNNELVKAAIDKTTHTHPVAIHSDWVGVAISASIINYTGNKEAMAQDFVFQTFMDYDSFVDLESGQEKQNLQNQLQAVVNNYSGNLPSGTEQLAEDLINSIVSSQEDQNGQSHEVVVGNAAFEAIFAVSEATEDITSKSYANIVIKKQNEADGRLSTATILGDIQQYQNIFNGFLNSTNYLPIPKGPKLPSIPDFASAIMENITPADQLKKRIGSLITVHKKVLVNGQYVYQKQDMHPSIDKLRPVMAYPKFDDPMFRNLKALSQEYILPNIEAVPKNSISLMSTNQKFIEAYMAGINHEMSRELLWREYPTDQRGTYFRQFWDVSDNQGADQESKYDIAPMDTWEDALGEHSNQPKDNIEDDAAYLVLLVRGELLKKYPNTQVYAQKAKYEHFDPSPLADNTPRILDESDPENNILFPVFMAELEPDIYLFGFDLDADVAKGDSTDENNPGWYFVLRERPGQIRFGLDEWTPLNDDEPDWPDGTPDDWNDLSWEHLVNQAGDLEDYQIDADDSLLAGGGNVQDVQAVWGKNAADMAFILYQNPVLFARHAQEMLPD